MKERGGEREKNSREPCRSVVKEELSGKRREKLDYFSPWSLGTLKVTRGGGKREREKPNPLKGKV